MEKLKSLASTALALVMVLVASTFISQNVLGASPCDNEPETAKIVVNGDWLAWAIQGPIYQGQPAYDDYYAAEGLEVELFSPADPADTLKFVAGGRVHITMTYTPDIMQAVAMGLPVISIATTLRPSVTGLEVPGDSGMDSPHDFKGKLIGGNIHPSAMAELKTMLAHVGIAWDEITFVDAGYSGLQMLVAGEIDVNFGLSNTDPVILNPQFEALGRPPIKFFRYADYGVPDYYYQLFAANPEWAKDNPATVCRFLRATAEGVKAFHENPNAVLDQMTKDNEMFTREMHGGLEEVIRDDWFDDQGRIWIQERSVWEAAQDWAQEWEIVEEKTDVSNYFTNDYLP